MRARALARRFIKRIYREGLSEEFADLDIIDNLINLAVEETEERILKALKLCKTCKGTHGEWITKEEIIKIIKKPLNKKNLGYGRSYGYPKKPLDRK